MMAAIVEDSVASVPQEQLAWLQHTMLQVQQPEATAATMQASGAAIPAVNGHAPSGGTAASASERTRASPSFRHPPPRVGASKSASAAEMEPMLLPSPSQEAFVAMTRASSFHGYPCGDTQPMESQVYRDFNTSMMQPATLTTPIKPMAQLSANAQTFTYDTMGTEKTPRTCVEGDTGFVDLENAAPSPDARSTSSFNDDFATSPQTQLHFEPGPAFTFALPETPAIAGHKRRHSGDILTSAATLPKQLAFSQLFGGAQRGPMLSATQAFDQTQAPSSPPLDGPRSDPVITRPSPNFHTRIDISSPAAFISSPVATMRPSTAGEPREVYTSVRESQERRAARFRTELSMPRDIDDDLLDDVEEEEADAERTRFYNKRMQKLKSEQANLEFAQVRAPSRPGSRPTSSPKTSVLIDLTTPATTKKGGNLEFEMSDDEHAEGNDMLPEDDDLEDAASSADEYDEFGQTVLRSQGNDHADEDEHMSVQDAQGADDGMNTKEDLRGAASAPLPQNQEASSAKNNGEPSSTQQFAIANSQPMPTEQVQGLAQQHVQQPSSISSFVPGSQYIGKTSQDQARLLSRQSSNVAQLDSMDVPPLQQRLPSSPPLHVHGSTLPELSSADEASKYTRRQIEIPESEPLLSDVRLSSSRPVSADGRGENDSNNQAIFSTAPTHLSQPERLSRKNSTLASPLKRVVSQQSKNASQSPLTAAGVRRFADIAAIQSPPRASNDTDANVDAIMDVVMTADDEEFFQVTSTPTRERPTKRRKVIKPSAEPSKDVQKSSKSKSVTMQASELEDQGNVDDGVDLDSSKAPEVKTGRPTSTKPLAQSLSKSNETLPLTLDFVNVHEQAEAKAVPRIQPHKPSDMLSMTQDSVREREEAGAKAVSQLVSERRPRSKGLANIKHQTKAPKRVYSVKRRREAPSTNAAVVVDDASISDVGEAANEGEFETLRVVAPNRVFTLFKGQFNNFYTATWVCASPDRSTHLVRFDDGTQTHIEPQHIRKLELRQGDQVKINLDGMRSKTWLVRGFEKPVTDPRGPVQTDMFGRSHLRVQCKSSRSSTPSSTTAIEAEGAVILVAIADVYLTHSMWPHFASRAFIPPLLAAAINSRAATPSSGVQTPNEETPTSRSRRGMFQSTKAPHGRSVQVREELVPFVNTLIGKGIFSRMAFAISYSSNEDEKLNVIRLIQRNGGIVLEMGFDELFDLPTLSETASSGPGKKSPKKDVSSIDEMAGLRLVSEYQDLGFVALIADRHSRREKYMQALALGIPTLSGRWIIDSLEPTRNASLAGTDAAPLPWGKYLLPAGESSFLGGATRSRTLSEYAAKEASLSHTLENRGLLLNGDGVLIVAPKKGKGAWERHRTYAFLTLALGAERVKRVADAQEAKLWTVEEPGKWRWIYVDGSVAEASSIVLGKGAADGKKRKRDEATKADTNAMVTSNGGDVTIVTDEYVIQTLILGALIDN